MKTRNPYKLIFRYYAWLFDKYNKVAYTGGNKTLIRRDDGSYTPAGVKGQIIGYVVVNAYLGAMFYVMYLLGKKEGHAEAQIEAFREDIEKYDQPFTSAP